MHVTASSRLRDDTRRCVGCVFVVFIALIVVTSRGGVVAIIVTGGLIAHHITVLEEVGSAVDDIVIIGFLLGEENPPGGPGPAVGSLHGGDGRWLDLVVGNRMAVPRSGGGRVDTTVAVTFVGVLGVYLGREDTGNEEKEKRYM